MPKKKKSATDPYSHLLYCYRQIFQKLPSEKKWQFYKLATVMLVLAVVETFAVGVISFYAAAVSDPASTLKVGFVTNIENFFGSGFFFSKKAFIGYLSFLVIFIVSFKNSLRGIFVYLVSRYSAQLEAYYGHQLLENFLFKPYIWHVQQNSADLVQIVAWRTYLGRNFVTPLLNILSEACVLLTLLISLLLIEPVISVLFLVVQGGATFIFYKKFKASLDKTASNCKEKDRMMNRQATMAIHGVKDVKITSSEPFFLSQFDSLAMVYAKNFGWQQFWREAPLLTLESVGFVLVCGAILFMLYVLKYSPLAITGTTALLAVTAWRMLPALNRVLAALNNIRAAKPYVESIFPHLPEIAKVSNTNDHHTDSSFMFEGTLEFRNVSFSYLLGVERKILDNLNLVIKQGQTIGIVGPSGCGKSTFIDLMVGFLTPQEGEILVDGKTLCQETIGDWVNQIGYVPQFPYIFDGSLAENIAFGHHDGEIDREKVKSVCRMSAIDFLDRLPQGIDSMIGERGVRLSGGQRQRVAIARALYRDPSLIIFDEATSALDEKKDNEIRKLISQLKGGRTLVLVSHRPSTLIECDVIFQFPLCD